MEVEATLLVELLTEELPPKSLARLSQAFCDALMGDLRQSNFLTEKSVAKAFATPRRLAVLVSNVLAKAPDRSVEVAGPSVKVGLDGDGKPTPALMGFAKKRGVSVDELEQIDTPKGKVFTSRELASGGQLETSLDLMVAEALKRLPVPKLMRWGSGEAQFVRPVHGLVMLHGSKVVPGTVLGLESGDRTRGHRFMGRIDIVLKTANEYESRLLEDGMVVADFAVRRTLIEKALSAEAGQQNAGLGEHEDLLDEVTALVEHPSVYAGAFDPVFLDVPQECLILTMRKNQKYFPLFGADGKLLPRFLIVSNMQLDDPRHIVEGNQRVVRPRLEDARFFFNQDRRIRLEARVPHLAAVVYHAKLGSQLERVERLQLLSGKLARALGADPLLAERAAWLAKADLLTGMVGEFPELQGTMGRHYALHDEERAVVADAIEQHYRPRYAGDALPDGPVALAVALADKLDTLAGFFGIGQQPTGDKDPYGLRRAALGVVRIIVERELPIALNEMVNEAFAGFNKRVADAQTDLEMFIFERYAGYLKEQRYSTLEVDAVLCLNPARLDVVPRQLEAVRAFQALPEAESLAAANKRVANILKQAAAKGESFRNADLTLLEEPAERALFEALRTASDLANASFERGDYAGYLKNFAILKTPVDAFFDSVKVMVEHDALRRNRLALLTDLREAMNRVADISRLAT
jgi:glycyl-tRNA synthetase beta chain